jgi:hypothetical protein
LVEAVVELMSFARKQVRINQTIQTQVAILWLENKKVRRTLYKKEEQAARKLTDAQVKLAPKGLGRVLTMDEYREAMVQRKEELRAEKEAKRSWKSAAKERSMAALRKRIIQAKLKR